MNVLQALQTTEKDNLAAFIMTSAVGKAKRELQFWDVSALSNERERLVLAITIRESVELICNLLEMVTEETGQITINKGEG